MVNIGQQVMQQNAEPVKITITLPTSAYFMSGIRDFTLSLTKNMTGFSNRWAYRFQSVVDELCNNAIEHGSAPGQNIKITFISEGNKSIEVFVEDTGTGAKKVKADELFKLVKERQDPGFSGHLGIRGRGLPKIVAEWTDELEFVNNEVGGLVVHVKKNLDPEESAKLAAENPDHNHIVLSVKPQIN